MAPPSTYQHLLSVTSAKAIMEGKALKEKSRVEQFERIRRDQRDEGLSVRALAARHRVNRHTVRRALADAVPPAPKTPVQVSPALGPYEAMSVPAPAHPAACSGFHPFVVVRGPLVFKPSPAWPPRSSTYGIALDILATKGRLRHHDQRSG